MTAVRTVVASALLALAIWQGAVWATGLPRFILPGPLLVAETIWKSRALLAELARVSDQHLLVSYLSPFSFSGFKRWIKWRLTGRRHRQNHTPLSELIWIMAAQGFVLVSDERQRGLWRALHLAHFKRVPVR